VEVVLLVAVGVLILAALLLVWRVARANWSLLKKTGAIGGILLLVVAILLGDHFVGSIRFQQLCEGEGGLRILRSVTGIQGFLFYSTSGQEFVKRGFYEFVEARTGDTTFVRFSRNASGGVTTEHVQVPQSKFRVRRERKEIDNQLGVTRVIVEDITSSEVLAVDSTPYYKGGWIHRLLTPIGGGGYTCAPSEGVTAMLRSVLKN
jgi:hypothetical protein